MTCSAYPLWEWLMRHTLIRGKVIGIGFIALLVFCAGNAHTSDAKNESPIDFDAKQSNFVGPLHICWRNRDGKVPLTEIGILDTDLIRGIRCIVGDFDGNGYVDFAFQGRTTSNNTAVPAFKVLLYLQETIIFTEVIQGADVFLYPATDQVGEFGEPMTKTDGLVIWGEGGNTIVYLFNPESGTFESREYPSEHH